MKTISWIWLLFCAIFILLSIVSFLQANKKIEHFKTTERPLENSSVLIRGIDIDQPLKDFAKDLNEYVDTYNKSSATQNKIAAWGYLAAFLVSLASFLLEQRIIK